MKSVMTVLVMSLLIAGSAGAQGPDPVGEQFQVNSYTTWGASVPEVAADPQGNFVVVWKSSGSYGAYSDESDRSFRLILTACRSVATLSFSSVEGVRFRGG